MLQVHSVFALNKSHRWAQNCGNLNVSFRLTSARENTWICEGKDNVRRKTCVCKFPQEDLQAVETNL